MENTKPVSRKLTVADLLESHTKNYSQNTNNNSKDKNFYSKSAKEKP